MSKPTGVQPQHYREAMTVNFSSKITCALKKTLTWVPSVVLTLSTELVPDFVALSASLFTGFVNGWKWDSQKYNIQLYIPSSPHVTGMFYLLETLLRSAKQSVFPEPCSASAIWFHCITSYFLAEIKTILRTSFRSILTAEFLTLKSSFQKKKNNQKTTPLVHQVLEKSYFHLNPLYFINWFEVTYIMLTGT